jgi:N-methylhydantoinase A/oxoprolinase/acetone carboxylase beta subunit
VIFIGDHGTPPHYSLSSNIDLVNLRIVAFKITTEFAVMKVEATKISEPATEAVSGKTRFVYQSHVHEDSPIWDRSMLKCGHIVKGSTIISEMDNNTVILPSYKAEVDHVGNIVI